MIYTLTLNPALDLVARTPQLCPGKVNSYHSAALYPGGKGLNVSQMLWNLGAEACALGFCAGFSGEEILRRLGPVPTDFIRLPKGFSRMNLKLSAQGEETELNGSGPKVDQKSFAALLQKIKNISPTDTLVLAGSLPPTDEGDLYASIFACTKAQVVLDTAKLAPYLQYAPFLVKPNQQELFALYGEPISTPADALRVGKRLLRDGAQNALISLGDQGAVLFFGGESYVAPALPGSVVSPCGAGDSLLAGFLFGLTQSPAAALRWGIAAGAATAFSEGIAPGDAVRHLWETLPLPPS